MIKAAFFDIDGTLVPFGQERPPESTVEALGRLRERGVLVLLATGRRLGFISHVTDCLATPPDGLVCANGQHCLLGGKVVRESHLSPRDVRTALGFFEARGIYCVVAEAEESFANIRPEDALEVWDRVDPWPPYPLERLCAHGVMQLVACLPVTRREDERELGLILEDSKVTRWNNLGIDVIPREGGKELGVLAVARELGLARDELLAFGDAQNDVGMFGVVGTSVAMGGGDASLRATASLVTEPASEDGIAHALERLSLI